MARLRWKACPVGVGGNGVRQLLCGEEEGNGETGVGGSLLAGMEMENGAGLRKKWRPPGGLCAGS